MEVVMKKRVLVFGIIFALILSISVYFSFAEKTCEHHYIDDGDCTTPAYCSLCNKVMYVQAEHSYENIVSYDLIDGNMMLGGDKAVKCSNTGCSSTITTEVLPFITPLGYSIKQIDKNGAMLATLISSYIFNASEMDSFAEVYGKEIEYGIVCFVPSRMGNDPPILPDGTPDVTAIKLKLTGANGVNDLAVPQIPENSYDEKIVISAYLIIDKTVYYIQGNELNADFSQLVAVSCNDVLDKLANN